MGCAATNSTSFAVAEAYEDPRFDPREKLTARLRSAMYVPLHRADGSVLGVVQASNKVDGGAFREVDEELVQAIRCVLWLSW